MSQAQGYAVPIRRLRARCSGTNAFDARFYVQTLTLTPHHGALPTPVSSHGASFRDEVLTPLGYPQCS